MFDYEADVNAIIVNYDNVEGTLQAVQSITAQNMPVNIWVVDNSLDEGAITRLRAGLSDQATLLVNRTNVGFAMACNQAYQQSTQGDILLLNPDALLCPGALAALCETLRRHSNVGAVGPRVFWDRDRRFLLPPSTFPSFLDYWSRHWAWLGVRRRHGFHRLAQHYWRTSTPISVPALSGGHILLRREALEQVGGLFDERFFLYWEDSDLMARLRRAGWGLLMEPTAEAIHEYTHSPHKTARIEAGWTTYYGKHFEPQVLTHWIERLPLRARPPEPSVSLSVLEDDPISGVRFSVPGTIPADQTWLLEISIDGDRVPAMGCYGQTREVTVPGDLLQRLSGQPVYLHLTVPGRREVWQHCYLSSLRER